MMNGLLRASKSRISVANSATYSDAGSPPNPQSFPLPTDTKPGDLLLLMFSVNNNSYVSGLSSWTLIDASTSNANVDRSYVFAKIADGSEGSSVSVTFSNSGQDTTAISYRITGNRPTFILNQDYVFANTRSTGTNIFTPDPASITVPWPSDEALFFAIAVSHDGNFVFVSYPTNYDLGQLAIQTDSGGGQAILSAARFLRASAEDPGVFTTSGSSRKYDTYTIAIRSA